MSEINSLLSPLVSGSNVLIAGGSFVQHNDATKVLDPLYDKVSPNAIMNSGGRADTVRCHPGTREEVIAKIERWRRADHSEGHPIFWLSGPAGAGKSAIVQTIAERCIEEKAPMVNFFFFRADASRNHVGPVVATLLFQLFRLFPPLKARITNMLADDPVILRQSLQVQFVTLIKEPLRAICKTSGLGTLIVLIDGLDECSSEHGKAEQSLLLRILHNIASEVNPAFIVLVASRTEAHLTMNFNELGASPASIFLDDSYRPLDDIRLFLTAEFSRIRTTHRLRATLDENWPLLADFKSILDKSSGQFVYAATVTRFIASSAASPKRSLEIVLGLRPATKTSPFATLDSLYTYILSQADDWKSVYDILAAQKVGFHSTRFLTDVLSHLGYTEDDILSNLSDLTAIIKFEAGDDDLTVYHASLDDFLYDNTRAGTFYIDVNAFACSLVPRIFKHGRHFSLMPLDILRSVTEPNNILNEFLISYVPDASVYPLSEVSIQRSMEILELLPQPRDPQLSAKITDHWRKVLTAGQDVREITEHSQAAETPLTQSPKVIPTQSAQRPSAASRLFSKFHWKRNKIT